jgi:hypothetical protein
VLGIQTRIYSFKRSGKSMKFRWVLYSAKRKQK